MTLKEADEAAVKRLPVVHDGIEYLRIYQTGYRYDENGQRHGFVVLFDKCGHSVTETKPELVKLKEQNT
jgi:hypothetical protein